MPDLEAQLSQRLRAAIAGALGVAADSVDPQLRPSNDPKFGDFQANAAMALAKQRGAKPRELAQQIVDHLDVTGLCSKVEIAGPGFINLTLDPAALGAAAAAMLADDRLGVAAAEPPRTVVVDYASPNLAKEMHVGHLRSTIIGDALVRVLECQGHRVIRQNHIGDWGTQFGMLLEHLIETGWAGKAGGGADAKIADLNVLYQEAKKRDDSEPDFAERARKRVVALQGGEAQSRQLWQMLIGESVRHMNEVFARLGVTLGDGDLRPESFYNDMLAPVADDLSTRGVATVSDGALCFFEKDDRSDTPLIVRKRDGGFGYGATDLAAVRYRTQELHADRVIYVVDSRQREHLGKVFAAARKAGYAEGVALEHVAFGTVLGPDRRPFKTREGGTVRLIDLIREADERALAVVQEKATVTDAAEQKRIAHIVGIGALKYADLASDRIKDYVFDWGRMLAMEGNTAPYLQYSYTRVRSIFRKAGLEAAALGGVAVTVADPAERALVAKVLQWPRVVEAVGASLEPHRLCGYLYELAGAYHQFYERCPVLAAADEATRASRLALCALTAAVLQRGLALLGIGVVEQM
mgnify:CR=1 FL=1